MIIKVSEFWKSNYTYEIDQIDYDLIRYGEKFAKLKILELNNDPLKILS